MDVGSRVRFDSITAQAISKPPTTENRNGLIIDLRVGQATGRAEREQGLTMIFFPRLSISSDATLDPSDPFATPFILHNDGYFSVYSAEIICKALYTYVASLNDLIADRALRRTICLSPK